MKPIVAPTSDADRSQSLSETAQKVHAVLPQTQCRRCGWADCASYAQAVVNHQAAINQCPPGASAGIQRIASALGNMELANNLSIDPAYGCEAPLALALIDEAWCVGCTKCIAVCPVDAIIGSHKAMHTVMSTYCTGCELCISACPVDCIRMEAVDNKQPACNTWTEQQAKQALQRYTAHQARTAPQPAKVQTPALSTPVVQPQPEIAAKQSVIESALARARARREKLVETGKQAKQ